MPPFLNYLLLIPFPFTSTVGDDPSHSPSLSLYCTSSLTARLDWGSDVVGARPGFDDEGSIVGLDGGGPPGITVPLV